MQSLRDVERDFARALLGEADGAVVASILGDGLSPAARLGVYRNHAAGERPSQIGRAHV